MQVSLHVTCHEVGSIYKIGRTDRSVTETQVRASEAARLLRVVGEVSLTVFVGVLTDDLHRVLVGTDCTVGTQAVEFSLIGRLVAESLFRKKGKRGEIEIIHDTHSEVILGLRECEVVKYRDDHGRSGILRGKTEAAAHDHGSVGIAVETLLHIKQQRLAVGAWLLGAVEHGDALCGSRHSSHEMLYRERTEQVYCHEAYLLAFLYEIVDSLFGSLTYRAHGDDHAIGIGSSVVIEQTVLAAGDLRDLVHVLLDNIGH